MTLQDYLRAPYAALSIPYWKVKSVQIPPHMRIVHRRDYHAEDFPGYADEPYFRLMHVLKDIAPANDNVVCRTAEEADLALMADIINSSYDDLSITLAQLWGYRITPAYAADLWVIALDAQTGVPAGCGIADLDPEARECVLEWIQVLPEYRGWGVGQCIVNELLRRMADRADFATVSGRVNNATGPERMYRRCGFAGDDVWHVLTKK